MKFVLLLTSVLLSLILFKPAYGQDAAPNQAKLRGFSMSQDFSYDGVTYTYRLSTSDLVNTPSWNPLSEEPPFPMRKALEVSALNLRRFVKDADGWDVGSISLKQMDTEKWIYEVSFACNHRECSRKNGSSFIFLVKMDGSIVEPEVAPYRQPKK